MSAVTPIRAPSGQFLPGQSGNPGGRPRDIFQIAELARTHSPLAIRALAEICEDSGAPHSARVSAAVALLNRAWGLPVQTVDLEQKVDLGRRHLEVLTELAERGRQLANSRQLPAS
jgi:hypothetical protein